MSQIKEKVRLVFSDLKKNSYKYWDGELFDDGTVISTWGVVGATNPQSKNYGRLGKGFLDRKVKEKLKKGYEHAKVIISDAPISAAAVSKASLADIAVSQIKSSSALIERVIRRLADSNVHKITKSTSISFDNGVFQTPLGVVTQGGIDEARDMLAWFNANIKSRFNDDFHKQIDKYLKIIPRPKGRGLLYEDIFPDIDAIQKESDILDALENSLKIATTPKQDDSKKAPAEQVFDLSFDIEEDKRVRKALETWFGKSNKAMHHYTNKRVAEVYRVDIHNYNRNFRDKLGNNVQVWHGSGQANILSILKSGLFCSPPSTAAIAGKMFGNGVYGSETSSKSLGYSLGRWGQSSGDSGWLFVCDFAMGNAYYPMRGGGLSRIPAGYDSCWALPKNTGLYNDELIVYNEDQIKIKYLLEIK